MLERLREGQFVYEHERALGIRTALAMPQNRFLGDRASLLLGQKLQRDDFECKENGTYWVDNGESISVFAFDDEGVHYLLNKVAL